MRRLDIPWNVPLVSPSVLTINSDILIKPVW